MFHHGYTIDLCDAYDRCEGTEIFISYIRIHENIHSFHSSCIADSIRMLILSSLLSYTPSIYDSKHTWIVIFSVEFIIISKPFEPEWENI